MDPESEQGQSFQAKNILGVCLWQVDRLEEAITVFDAIIEEFPDREEPRQNKKNILVKYKFDMFKEANNLRQQRKIPEASEA